jgi:hypothetical protein
MNPLLIIGIIVGAFVLFGDKIKAMFSSGKSPSGGGLVKPIKEASLSKAVQKPIVQFGEPKPSPVFKPTPIKQPSVLTRPSNPTPVRSGLASVKAPTFQKSNVRLYERTANLMSGGKQYKGRILAVPKTANHSLYTPKNYYKFVGERYIAGMDKGAAKWL